VLPSYLAYIPKIRDFTARQILTPFANFNNRHFSTNTNTFAIVI